MSHHDPDASTFATLSLVDLDAVCGGEATSPSTSQQSTTINPTLSCPAGTSPRFETSTTSGGGFLWGAFGGGGSTTSTKFSCDPVPQQAPQSGS